MNNNQIYYQTHKEELKLKARQKYREQNPIPSENKGGRPVIYKTEEEKKEAKKQNVKKYRENIKNKMKELDELKKKEQIFNSMQIKI